MAMLRNVTVTTDDHNSQKKLFT